MSRNIALLSFDQVDATDPTVNAPDEVSDGNVDVVLDNIDNATLAIERLSNDVEQLDRLATCLEGMLGEGGADNAALSVVNTCYEHRHQSIHQTLTKKKLKPAYESVFNLNAKIENTKIAQEGVIDLAKAAGRKILEMIRSIIKYFSNLNIFNKKKVSDLDKEIKKQKEDIKRGGGVETESKNNTTKPNTDKSNKSEKVHAEPIDDDGSLVKNKRKSSDVIDEVIDKHLPYKETLRLESPLKQNFKDKRDVVSGKIVDNDKQKIKDGEISDNNIRFNKILVTNPDNGSADLREGANRLEDLNEPFRQYLGSLNNLLSVSFLRRNVVDPITELDSDYDDKFICDIFNKELKIGRTSAYGIIPFEPRLLPGGVKVSYVIPDNIGTIDFFKEKVITVESDDTEISDGKLIIPKDKAEHWAITGKHEVLVMDLNMVLRRFDLLTNLLDNIGKFFESKILVAQQDNKLNPGKFGSRNIERVSKVIMTIANNALLTGAKYIKYMINYLNAAAMTHRKLIDALNGISN